MSAAPMNTCAKAILNGGISNTTPLTISGFL